MAALVVRMYGYRLTTCRHRIARFNHVAGNVKCMFQNLYLSRSLSVVSSPFANNGTTDFVVRDGTEKDRLIRLVKLTGVDADDRSRIGRLLVGRGGQNIKRLTSEIGPNIHMDVDKETGLITVQFVSGTDAEMVNTAVEKVKAEIQRIKTGTMRLPFNVKVLTDEDADVRAKICRLLVGSGGKNIKRLTSEMGPNIHLDVDKTTGVILVFGTDAETVNTAVEKVQQEIQIIKTI